MMFASTATARPPGDVADSNDPPPPPLHTPIPILPRAPRVHLHSPKKHASWIAVIRLPCRGSAQKANKHAPCATELAASTGIVPGYDAASIEFTAT